jgi:hypothetical protein
LLDKLDTFCQIEQRSLARAVGDTDHHLVKQLGGAADEIGVAIGNGIKSPGINYPGSHLCGPATWKFGRIIRSSLENSSASGKNTPSRIKPPCIGDREQRDFL